MNGMPTHIKLYSEKQNRFEEIKRDLTEELGYEPTNPEVIGFLMAQYRGQTDSRADSDSIRCRAGPPDAPPSTCSAGFWNREDDPTPVSI